jgi:hypothetical protein
VAGSCEHGNVVSGSIKAGNFLTSRVTICFTRRTLLHGVSQTSSYKIVFSILLVVLTQIVNEITGDH